MTYQSGGGMGSAVKNGAILRDEIAMTISRIENISTREKS
jgi:hypothetical protein